jgi:hypothetical protein
MIITFTEFYSDYPDTQERRVNTFVHNISYFYPAFGIHEKGGVEEVQSCIVLHHTGVIRVKESCEEIELLIKEAMKDEIKIRRPVNL